MEECPLCIEPFTLAHHLRVKHGMIRAPEKGPVETFKDEKKRKRKLPLKPVIKEKKRKLATKREFLIDDAILIPPSNQKTDIVANQEPPFKTANQETDVVANQKEVTDEELSN